MKVTLAFFLLILFFGSQAQQTLHTRKGNPAKSKIVLLDCFFNHETKKDSSGKIIQFHYLWNEPDNGGYSVFGSVFNKYNVQTKELFTAPSSANLRNAAIYIIVDPDDERENQHPNYIENNNINAIYKWVNEGGVLLLFGNDSANVEFTHFNRLAAKFGIQFNYDCKNHVIGDQFEMGAINIDPGNLIFKTAKKIYIKDYSSLTIMPPASVIIKDGNTIVVAVAKIGKGTVFAVGDPWFYNEYTDGKKLPPYFENYKAAEDLVKWSITQAK